jgi:hypothetical protein
LDEAPSAPELRAPPIDPPLNPALDNVPELTPNIAVMQERYPLLRNAM